MMILTFAGKHENQIQMVEKKYPKLFALASREADLKRDGISIVLWS